MKPVGMAADDEDSEVEGRRWARDGATVPDGRFPKTHWSVVKEAAGEGAAAKQALEKICRAYWLPLYVYVRRQGKGREDAEDLTQGFFEYLLKGGYLAQADESKGRLRSYLLGALKHFVSSEWRRNSAKKRGGGRVFISIDADAAEKRLKSELADGALPPDKAFDRRWAIVTIERVMDELRRKYEGDGKIEEFEVLSPYFSGRSGEGKYAEAGARLGKSEGTVKVAVHRMRKRYRSLLRSEIGRTVASAEEIEEEIEFLFRALE